MTQKECREKILTLWVHWPQRGRPATYEQKHSFYMWLESERQDLLSFRVGRGQQKWQTVHAWLNRWENGR